MDPAPDKDGKLSDTLVSTLRSGRAELNARFAEARRLYPELDGAEFLSFLRTCVDPLVRAVEQACPGRAADVALGAYEAGLELVGQKLAGPGARDGFVENGWRRVLCPAARLVASAPGRVVGAVSNALHHLATTPGARPEQWLNELERLGPQCGDVEALLRLGQVEGWRAGLAHFRQGALAAADALPSALALSAVGAGGDADWPKTRNRLGADPWFDPGAPAGKAGSASLRVMAQAGAFRGFGGLFVEPPRVAAAGEHFLVRSGPECWLLTADVFGATFHRASLGEFESASRQARLPAGVQVADSKVSWQGERFEIPTLGKFTSAAANATTLALTSELTHSVVLVALR